MTYGYTLVTDTKFFVLFNISTSKDHKSMKRYSVKICDTSELQKMATYNGRSG